MNKNLLQPWLRATGYLRRQLDFNLLHRRNKPRYLRHLGAQVGDRCQIITAIKNFGTEPYLIRIGSDVTITDGVVFVNHDASTRLFRSRYAEMNRFGNLFGPIIIGDNCFIGINTILLPGTEIGPNSIVGAGAVVKGAFPPGSVLAGVPARRIYSLDEYIERVRTNMVPLRAATRTELRAELLAYFADRLERGPTARQDDVN